MTRSYVWWQTGVIYQVYPWSFQDSNDDGIGDLPGILSRLDYLQSLGIDAIWLSPIFPSPMADFGYDISDYVAIDPRFGTLADFDRLLDAAHQRGIKMLLDLVPNHTSDEHPWFLAARSSREHPQRDWYIWRDPAPDGGPPNNWDSYFGGPAWTFDPATGQYYLHLFDPKQPDLNWRNPKVRAAMLDVMRFWLNRGVDGFRVDVIWMLIKDAQLRDNPVNPDWKPGDPPWLRQIKLYNEDQPEVHDVIRAMRAVIDAYPDRAFIGEIYLPITKLVHYYGPNLDEVHMPFNFQLLLMQGWDARQTREAVDAYEAALPEGGWPNWVLGNHDRPRIASRVGLAQARVAQMLLLTLRGTPTCYYGDEIGMRDTPIPQEQVKDPQGIRSPGYSRDPVRTPMQWDAGPNAGFSANTPWLPLATDYAARNVHRQDVDPTSELTLFRRLIVLRRSISALTIGDYHSLDIANPAIFAYLRTDHDQRVLIVLNFSATTHELDLSTIGATGEALCSTHLDRSGTVDLAKLAMRADEGLIIHLIRASG